MSALLVPAEIVKFLPCDEVGMLMLLLSLLLSSKSPERVNLFAASESKSVSLAHPIFPLSETSKFFEITIFSDPVVVSNLRKLVKVVSLVCSFVTLVPIFSPTVLLFANIILLSLAPPFHFKLPLNAVDLSVPEITIAS